MIVVRVELHSAITGKVTEIARAEIINDGTGTSEVGNYKVRSLRGRSTAAFDERKLQREGWVKDWPRLERHVWNLVTVALASMGYGHFSK